MEQMERPFGVLNKVNVQEHVEKKNKLSYLAWAWAWGELKKRYPDSYYTIYENKDGFFYHTDGNTCWVKTGVTVVDGEYSLEHIEYLPVMDYRNSAISLESVTSFDVNKTIQRSLTKAVARHGLGLYIYAGEDLPEEEEEPVEKFKLDKRQALNDLYAKLETDEKQFGTVLNRLRGEGKVSEKSFSDMKDFEFTKALKTVEDEYIRVRDSFKDDEQMKMEE